MSMHLKVQNAMLGATQKSRIDIQGDNMNIYKLIFEMISFMYLTGMALFVLYCIFYKWLK